MILSVDYKSKDIRQIIFIWSRSVYLQSLGSKEARRAWLQDCRVGLKRRQWVWPGSHQRPDSEGRVCTQQNGWRSCKPLCVGRCQATGAAARIRRKNCLRRGYIWLYDSTSITSCGVSPQDARRSCISCTRCSWAACLNVSFSGTTRIWSV